MPSHAATGTLTAATHSHILSGLITLAVVTLVILAAGYALTCWLFPFTTCRHTNPRHAWRCHRCEGTGRRVRAGRRLINDLRATRHH
ncbi:hypothetical protein [Actinophytocola sp.]|uniref:hypothetical protein n=1 Tax=Actinophytocola sp. TaxID=1872138 RepID=UPI00389A0C8C